MSLHDPSAGMSYRWDWHIRWPRIRHGLGQLRPKGSRPGARVRVRHRKLAAIERALVADAPALSAKFALFNHVTRGERPVGLEQVSAPSWPRPQPALAVLLALPIPLIAAVNVDRGKHEGKILAEEELKIPLPNPPSSPNGVV